MKGVAILFQGFVAHTSVIIYLRGIYAIKSHFLLLSSVYVIYRVRRSGFRFPWSLNKNNNGLLFCRKLEHEIKLN